LTFATTLEAIIGAERLLAKVLVKETGSTLSMFPPVISASLVRESRLHSSPMIDTRLTMTPFYLANSAALS